MYHCTHSPIYVSHFWGSRDLWKYKQLIQLARSSSPQEHILVFCKKKKKKRKHLGVWPSTRMIFNERACKRLAQGHFGRIHGNLMSTLAVDFKSVTFCCSYSSWNCKACFTPITTCSLFFFFFKCNCEQLTPNIIQERGSLL